LGDDWRTFLLADLDILLLDDPVKVKACLAKNNLDRLFAFNFAIKLFAAFDAIGNNISGLPDWKVFQLFSEGNPWLLAAFSLDRGNRFLARILFLALGSLFRRSDYFGKLHLSLIEGFLLGAAAIRHRVNNGP